MSWDTLPASDQQQRPRYRHQLIKRIAAQYVRPGYWVYVPAPVHRWFEVADFPSSSKTLKDGITIPLIGHDLAIFNRHSKASVLDGKPGDTIIHY